MTSESENLKLPIHMTSLKCYENNLEIAHTLQLMERKIKLIWKEISLNVLNDNHCHCLKWEGLCLASLTILVSLSFHKPPPSFLYCTSFQIFFPVYNSQDYQSTLRKSVHYAVLPPSLHSSSLYVSAPGEVMIPSRGKGKNQPQVLNLNYFHSYELKKPYFPLYPQSRE